MCLAYEAHWPGPVSLVKSRLKSVPFTRIAQCLLLVASGVLLRMQILPAHAAPASAATTLPNRRVLRIAADPNNLPFSNDRLEGFENKIADLLAQDLGAEIEYTWHAQRRGFFRETLRDGTCDLVLGVPSDFERVLTTRPYYRSSYAFVFRADSGLSLRSLNDAALHRIRIGVQLVGNDGADTPPAHALARRGIIENVVGYTLYGNYRQPNPPARIVDAVAHRDIDAAIVWGPLAGYFARREPVPLTVVPVAEQQDGPSLPLAFDISMGVRKKDQALRDTLDDALVRRRQELEAILAAYGVPRVENAARPANGPARSATDPPPSAAKDAD